MNLLRRLLDLLADLTTYFVVMGCFVLPFYVFMKVFNRTEIIGKKNVQRTKPPFLFISNHVSMLDDAFVGPLVFLPRALWNYHFIPYHLPEKKNFYRGPFFSFVMCAVKCIPITRGQGVFQPGMEKLIRKLKEGGTLHVFPEGTRTRTGEIGKGKIGVGRLVRESGAKVIPCYHSGLEQVLPIGHKIPRIGKRVRIQIGEALNLDKYMEMPNAPKTWQMISIQMIEAIKQQKDKLFLAPTPVEKPDGDITPNRVEIEPTTEDDKNIT
jgi:1-acyl-sn-glycerol-3-phosphate acyltransferase